MAQKVEVHLVDDLDGTPADETILFGLDGRAYEIDLTEKHATSLREALEPFVAAGRKVGGRLVRGTRAKTPTPAAEGVDLAEVRKWAKEHGFDWIKDRGRVPIEVMRAYQARA